MGNPDLAVIINGGEFCFVLLGKQYVADPYNTSVFGIATARYTNWADKMIDIAEEPTELDLRIKKIEVCVISHSE